MTQEYQTLIVRDSEIMFGKPTIKGTRITVETVLRRIATGMSVQEITEDFPHVSEDQVKAAFEYAADHLREARTPSNEAAG